MLEGIEMKEDRFLDLLGKLIGESEHLQDNPPDLVPREDAASDHVIAALAPYSTEAGGPIKVERVSFEEGRGNIILTYPGYAAPQASATQRTRTLCCSALRESSPHSALTRPPWAAAAAARPTAPSPSWARTSTWCPPTPKRGNTRRSS